MIKIQTICWENCVKNKYLLKNIFLINMEAICKFSEQEVKMPNTN